MAKEKSRAVVRVPDGRGGMQEQLPDARFESRDDWPIALHLPGADAAEWIAHLHAECTERRYRIGSLSQVEYDVDMRSEAGWDPNVIDNNQVPLSWFKTFLPFQMPPSRQEHSDFFGGL